MIGNLALTATWRRAFRSPCHGMGMAHWHGMHALAARQDVSGRAGQGELSCEGGGDVEGVGARQSRPR